MDKCEQQQHEELKVSSKRIRNEQEKELKSFRESLKQEVNTQGFLLDYFLPAV